MNGIWYKRSIFGGWEYRIQQGRYTHMAGPFITKALAIKDAKASKRWVQRYGIRKQCRDHVNRLLIIHRNV